MNDEDIMMKRIIIIVILLLSFADSQAQGADTLLNEQTLTAEELKQLQIKKKNDSIPWKHYVGLKIGSMAIVDEGMFGFRFGLNYELTKWQSHLGFGVMTELMLSDVLEFNLGFPFYLHDFFLDELNFVVTPGFAFVEHVKYVVDYVPNTPFDSLLTLQETVFRPNFMLRIGAYWDFYVYGKDKPWFMVSPSLNFDVISYRKLYLMFGVRITVLLDENIYKL